MEKIVLSRRAFNLVVASLVNLEDSQRELLQYYFPSYDKDNQAIQSMIKDYIQKMDLFLKRISVVDDPGFNQIPFVIIGSKITLQELEGKSIDEFRLIAPFETMVNEGDISIFSPIGRALLLKEHNSIVEYDAPGGSFAYKILSIYL